MKQDERLRGLIYYGLSPFFKMAVKIARRIHIFDFRLEVVEHYDQAVRLAQKILPGLTGHPDPVNSWEASKTMAGDPLKETSRPTVTHDHWQFQREDYSVRYEVINGNIIHVITTGTLNEREIIESYKNQGTGNPGHETEGRFLLLFGGRFQPIAESFRKSA